MERPPLKIALIAGEVSGDQLGGWLMEAIKKRRPDTVFLGVGGTMMADQGLNSLFPLRDIALMGLAEILPHIRKLSRRIRETVAFLEHEKPDMIITIDSPGFALRVLKQLHAHGKIRPKLVHYVAPSVWAYRPQRAKVVAERYDHLLCLLPFEPPYFEAEGLASSYIGHEIAWWWKSSQGDGPAFRARHTIPENAPLLAVFPGSRQGEIKRLWPIFKKAIEQMHASIPSLAVAIQVPASILPILEKNLAGWSIPHTLLPNNSDKKGLFAASTAALSKSGTIGLECALAGLAGIIAYRANPISAYLLRRMIRIPYVSLANILAGKMIVPEFLQQDCTPEKLSNALAPLLTDPAKRQEQQQELSRIANLLGAADNTSPSDKAAAILLDLLPA